MEELGTVISVKGKKAKVLINRHAACGECGACQIGREKMTMETIANNEIGAQPGQNVMVYMKFISVMTATSIAYGIPLLFFMLGILGGWFLAPIFHLDQVLFSFSIGIILLIISYTLIYLAEKMGWLKLKFQPIITQFAEENNK